MDIQRAQAVLFGLALGDALGCPVEFNSLHQIKDAYGPDGILEPPDPAYYTDDTQMTIALAEGLLENSLYVSLDSQMTSIGQRFLTWMHSPENTRSPGNTVMAGLARYESGISWRESGLPNSKGCGSAMRVATIGCLYREDPPRLWEVASASSFITHRHPTAIAAAVAAAYAVALALADVPPQDFIPHILAFCDGLSDELDTALLRVGHVLGWGSEEAALDHIGQGWTGEEAVALALYCVLRYPDDYVACVRRGANTNGDSDSIACIAGGVMGARLGLEAIPWEWIDRCENRDYLFDLGEKSRTGTMKLFSFDPKLGKEIAEFNSANAFINRIALTDSRLSVVCILLEPGGTLGLHPASENQLFLVVSGQGWVRSGETGRVPIRTFQAAFWQAGENHETGSDHGLVAVVVEGRDLQPHPYMKEVI